MLDAFFYGVIGGVAALTTQHLLCHPPIGIQYLYKREGWTKEEMRRIGWVRGRWMIGRINIWWRW